MKIIFINTYHISFFNAIHVHGQIVFIRNDTVTVITKPFQLHLTVNTNITEFYSQMA